jgi:hypothetical protein
LDGSADISRRKECSLPNFRKAEGNSGEIWRQQASLKCLTGGSWMKRKKGCTSDIERIFGYIEEIYTDAASARYAKRLAEDVLGLAGAIHQHRFSIMCYRTTGPHVRFCIDRHQDGSDCERARTMTHFLVMKPPYEIHVIASGRSYLNPQTHTPFHIIRSDDLIELPYSQIWKHEMDSFCYRVNQYDLRSSLCTGR